MDEKFIRRSKRLRAWGTFITLATFLLSFYIIFLTLVCIRIGVMPKSATSNDTKMHFFVSINANLSDVQSEDATHILCYEQDNKNEPVIYQLVGRAGEYPEITKLKGDWYYGDTWKLRGGELVGSETQEPWYPWYANDDKLQAMYEGRVPPGYICIAVPGEENRLELCSFKDEEVWGYIKEETSFVEWLGEVGRSFLTCLKECTPLFIIAELD